MSDTMLALLADALLETIWMAGFAAILALAFGTPLGLALGITAPEGPIPRARLNRGLRMLVNVLRSIPFVLLMLALIPVTRYLVGSGAGPWAALLPLSVA